MKPTIHFMTYCKKEFNLPGNLPTLLTIRKGFPDNKVVVTENTSYPEARQKFKQICLENDFEYRELDREVKHADFLYQTIKLAQGPIVILDPDVIFWESCEGFFDGLKPDTLLKGRLIPNFRVAVPGRPRLILFAERIHTSFMVIPDPVALQEIILLWGERGVYLFDETPGYDTGALLYSKEKERITPFTPSELDCYDHMFTGTHTEQLCCPAGRIISDAFEKMHSVVGRAQTADDYFEVKGFWRFQEDFFKSKTFDLSEYPYLYNNPGFEAAMALRNNCFTKQFADVQIKPEDKKRSLQLLFTSLVELSDAAQRCIGHDNEPEQFYKILQNKMQEKEKWEINE